MGAPTVRDVARQAGVSVATVSYVLTGSRRVAAATRSRIEAAMRDLDFHPNRLAQGLARQRVDTVAVVLPARGGAADPLFAEFVHGVQDGAHAGGFHLLLASEGNLADAAAYEELVRGQAAAGLIVTSVRLEDARVAHLHRQRVPTVLFGRAPDLPTVPWVDIDNRGALREVVRHLATAGRRRIAYLGGPPGFAFAEDRRRGFLEGLGAHGLGVDLDLIREGLPGLADGYRLAREVLEHGPDALVAVSDEMACGALRAAQERGLAVGGDLAVVGFDDSPLARAAEPALTSVAQPTYEAGQWAARLLLDEIQGRPGGHRLLPARLVCRASSAAPGPGRSGSG